MNKSEAIRDCKACLHCGVVMHRTYFQYRTNRPGGIGIYPDCKACRRESWRRRNAAKRGSLRGYCKVQRITGTPETVADAILAMAAKMQPNAEGVRVSRLPSGEVLYWQGAMKPPRDAESIGLYDFDARREYILEDLAA